MKGIILAAGAGSRLFPVSEPISKILLPVYDKPMIYYPLSTLMLANIREIMIITSERDNTRFKDLLGDGSQFGVRIEYAIQYKQRGIADAFIIAEDFIDGDDVCLILGDNIFYGDGMASFLEEAIENNEGATIFGYSVHDPERFGVIEFDDNNNVLSLEEKPKNPRSNCAAVGLYFYDSNVCEIAKNLKESARGELEITDLNIEYLKRGQLKAREFGKGYTWIDSGTFDSLLDACITVRDLCKEAGRSISCPEEIALEMNMISSDALDNWLGTKKDNDYYGLVRKRCLE